MPKPEEKKVEKKKSALEIEQERMLLLFDNCKSLTQNVSVALTKKELSDRIKDPEFHRKRALAKKYFKHSDDMEDLAKSYSSHFGKTSNVTRFVRFTLKDPTSPENIEFNDDLEDMLLSPEGIQALRDHAIRTILAADYSICYPKNAEEAYDLVLQNPNLSEYLMIASMALNVDNNSTMDPFVEEMLTYNKTALEGSAYALSMARYYSSDACLLFHSKCKESDMNVIRDNIPGFMEKAKFKGSTEVMTSTLDTLGQIMISSQKRTAKYESGIQKLKEQGIIGPESMYYRAYDKKTKKRMPFEDAVSSFVNGNDIEFKKMTPDEQKKLHMALNNPTTKGINQKPVKNLLGKDFQHECMELYQTLDDADNFYVISSMEFSTVKSRLKDMATRKTVPTEEEIKRMLHDIVYLSNTYEKKKAAKLKDLNKKNRENGIEEEATLSERETRRRNAMNEVLEKCKPKLGILAARSFKRKMPGRVFFKKNQEDISKNMDQELKMQEKKRKITSKDINLPEKNQNSELGLLTKEASVAIAGIRNAMRPDAPADPDFKNGRYLSVVIAYALIKTEREKNKDSKNPGPLEEILQREGAKAFYKGVRELDEMKALTKSNITPDNIIAAMDNDRGRELIKKLSTKENIQKISEKATLVNLKEAERMTNLKIEPSVKP